MRDFFGEPVVFLQVDGEVGIRPRFANLGECGDVFRIVDGDANHVRAGRFEQLDLANGGIDVLSARGRHRLNGDRIRTADEDVADADLTSGASLHDVSVTGGASVSFRASEASRGTPWHMRWGSLDSLRSLGMTQAECVIPRRNDAAESPPERERASHMRWGFLVMGQFH